MTGFLKKGHFWGKRLKVRGLYGNLVPHMMFRPVKTGSYRSKSPST